MSGGCMSSGGSCRSGVASEPVPRGDMAFSSGVAAPEPSGPAEQHRSAPVSSSLLGPCTCPDDTCHASIAQHQADLRYMGSLYSARR